MGAEMYTIMYCIIILLELYYTISKKSVTQNQSVSTISVPLTTKRRYLHREPLRAEVAAPHPILRNNIWDCFCLLRIFHLPRKATLNHGYGVVCCGNILF